MNRLGRRLVKQMFLYIVPLKQGLKLSSAKEELKSRQEFLYIVPLKQGLKLWNRKVF